MREDGVTLRVRDDCVLDLAIDEPVVWEPRAFGGVGLAHAVPFLSQYWHPYLLGGRARGLLRLGGREIALDGARVYAEKNWGRGFPKRWWWGQAGAFADAGVCTAFAGGSVALGPASFGMRTAAVVRVGREVVRLVPPFARVRCQAGGGHWSIRAAGPRHRVTLEGRSVGDPHLLPIPVPESGTQRERAAAQHLAAEVQLEVRRGRRLVFAGTSPAAGLEVGNGA